MTNPHFPSPAATFPSVVMRAAALALVLARRDCNPTHHARVVRYARQRGLRGSSMSLRTRTMARALAGSFDAFESRCE